MPMPDNGDDEDDWKEIDRLMEELEQQEIDQKKSKEASSSGRSRSSRHSKPSPDGDGDGKGELEKLNVAELKDRLRLLGFPVSGRKAVLVERLRNATQQQPAGGGASMATASGTGSGETPPGLSSPSSSLRRTSPSSASASVDASPEAKAQSRFVSDASVLPSNRGDLGAAGELGSESTGSQPAPLGEGWGDGAAFRLFSDAPLDTTAISIVEDTEDGDVSFDASAMVMPANPEEILHRGYSNLSPAGFTWRSSALEHIEQTRSKVSEGGQRMDREKFLARFFSEGDGADASTCPLGKLFDVFSTCGACDFLVKKIWDAAGGDSDDGAGPTSALDLRRVLVWHKESGIYSVPETIGQLDANHRRYYVYPYVKWYPGDVLKPGSKAQKEGCQEVVKLILVAVKEPVSTDSEFELDVASTVVLDGEEMLVRGMDPSPDYDMTRTGKCGVMSCKDWKRSGLNLPPGPLVLAFNDTQEAELGYLGGNGGDSEQVFGVCVGEDSITVQRWVQMEDPSDLVQEAEKREKILKELEWTPTKTGVDEDSPFEFLGSVSSEELQREWEQVTKGDTDINSWMDDC